MLAHILIILFYFQFNCREALPRLENYRRSLRALKRPSLGILHGEDFEINQVSIRYYDIESIIKTKH